MWIMLNKDIAHSDLEYVIFMSTGKKLIETCASSDWC